MTPRGQNDEDPDDSTTDLPIGTTHRGKEECGVGSGARVRRIDHGPETLLAHMGVMLRRGEIGMTEQFLNGSEIGASIEKVGGKGVAQRVRMGRRWRTTVEESPDISRTETSTSLIEEHRIGG